MRKRIFEIIEASNGGDLASSIYDAIMMVSIFSSLFPLCFKSTNQVFALAEIVTTVLFILDYLLRLSTADYKLKKGAASFVLYPFSFMAIIDLLAILPSFNLLVPGLKILRMLRMLRTFRVLKVFKAFKIFRYSKSITIIINVIKAQREPLIAVGTLAIGYILIAALVIFNVEPDTFQDFF